MVRKCSCIVCAICVTMAMGVTVKAEEQLGTVQVIPEWCGQPVAEGTVSISRVGMVADTGIVLTDGLANWCVEEEDLESEEWIGWISQHTKEKKQSAVIQEGSGAAFENLKPGIYLVEQSDSGENYAPFRSFLQEIPENGQWNLAVHPSLIRTGEPPKTADRPAPIIGAMGIGLSAAILMVMADNRKK